MASWRRFFLYRGLHRRVELGQRILLIAQRIAASIAVLLGVLFVKRDHTQLRAIVGDGVGLYLICRRFEGGCLRDLAAFTPQPGAGEISTAELSLLLEGASFTVHQRARSWRGQDARQLGAKS